MSHFSVELLERWVNVRNHFADVLGLAVNHSNERCSVMELDNKSTSLDLFPAIVSSLSVSCVKLLIHLLIVHIVHSKCQFVCSTSLWTT